MQTSDQQTGVVAIDASVWGWTRSVEGIALFLFACGTMFLHGAGQQRMLGAILCAAVGLSCALKPLFAWRQLVPVPPEVALFAAWVVWAGITGPVVAGNLAAFTQGLRVVVQMLVMVTAVYAALRLRPEAMRGVFVALVCGGIVQVATVLAGSGGVAVTREGDRLMGMTGNPNVLGFMMTWTVLSVLILRESRTPGRRVLRWAGVGLIVLCAYVLLASGSRKSLMAFVFLVGSWAFFASCAGRSMRALAVRAGTAALTVALICVVMPFVLDHTTVGRRFHAVQNDGAGALRDIADAEGRTEMYTEGLSMVEEHPIAGVGLGNFAVLYWKGGYSHSDYIEPLASTGVVGFLLYQSFYILLLLRSARLLSVAPDGAARHRLKMIVIGTLTIMLIGLGSPHYDNQVVFLLLTTFSVYTRGVASAVRHCATPARAAVLLAGCPQFTKV